MQQPITIEDLISRWIDLINSLNDDNDEQVAYDMVGAFGGSKLFEEYKNEDKDPSIMEVFDSVADLELPDGINVKNKTERQKRWNLVKAQVADLSKKYLQK